MSLLANKLRILGKTVTIKYVSVLMGHFDDTEDDLGEDLSGAELLGRSSAPDNVIEISNGYPKDTQEATVLHEILEHIKAEMDLDIDHSDLNRLANCLYQVFADNYTIRVKHVNDKQ